MEVENETRPLLRTFENESWRSRTRRRCKRIPSEITITGIILGLFLVVVTLLIVLQNMEAEKSDGLTLDNNLLASPFKYNKKTEDKSWQEKKENMKNKDNVQASPMKFNKKAEDESWQEKKAKYKQKWDSVNKGWKQFPDISGKIENRGYKVLQKSWKDNVEASDIHQSIDEYGKEIDDSLEADLEIQMSALSPLREFNENATEIKNLLRSKIQWKDIDEGWKKLTEQGWSDKRIRNALFKAIKERRGELAKEMKVQQSPSNLDQIWDNIIESWKKNVKEGDLELKNNKVAKDHKSINEEWKNEMNVLQSPKSSLKKLMKDDIGWQKLSEQGWKNKDIEAALIEAWIEDKAETASLQQAPMNIQSLWAKATDFFKSLFPKGMDEQKSQQKINDEYARKFNILQSSMASSKKWKKDEELRKKPSKNGWKGEATDVTESKNHEPTEPSLQLEDFIAIIIDKIKEHIKDSKGKTADENGNYKPSHSSVNFDELIKELIIEKIKEHKKGENEQKSQKETNDEWAGKFNVLKSQWSSYKKWKKIDDLRKKHSKDEGEDKMTDETEDSNDQPLQSPINFEGFLEDIIERIKEHKKENKEAEKQKDINREMEKEMGILQSPKQKDKKWKQGDDNWRTLLEEGEKDKDIKEAVYNAWKGSDKLLQSSMGNKDMKWKKVNEGWKKISNKS